jgi:regulatory protein
MTDQDFDQLTAINPADIRLAAMNLLARREHSRCELKQKLRKRFDDDELIDQQLDRLSEENLQSDSRYAESFLRQRINRGHGPMRIRQEMRQKGISDDEISAALEAEEPDWFVLAEEAYQRRFGALPPEDIKEKAKRSRFMQYRGFGLDHYQHLLDRACAVKAWPDG